MINKRKPRSHITNSSVSPVTDLVAECGKPKTKKEKPKKWYWTAEHHQAFKEIERTVSEEVILAASLGQLFSLQTKYAVTEQELLFIVECLNEFKGMPWGQKINSFGINCSGGGQKIKAQPPLHKRCKGEGKSYTIS